MPMYVCSVLLFIFSCLFYEHHITLHVKKNIYSLFFPSKILLSNIFLKALYLVSSQSLNKIHLYFVSFYPSFWIIYFISSQRNLHLHKQWMSGTIINFMPFSWKVVGGAIYLSSRDETYSYSIV